MLNEREKKEMRDDGRDHLRRDEFFLAEQKRPKTARSLNDYISFLMSVQAIKPFEHKRAKTPAEKNIL